MYIYLLVGILMVILEMSQNQIQKQENNEIQLPPPAELTYSVRIEQTVKGARISVHCYKRILELAAREAIEAYLSTRRQLKEVGLKVAYDCRSNGFANVQVYLAGKDDQGRAIRLESDGVTPHVHKTKVPSQQQAQQQQQQFRQSENNVVTTMHCFERWTQNSTGFLMF
jgi:hypothetical protein